jgi:phosphomannomutase/phosphomannomutase/phosphoglucomutase
MQPQTSRYVCFKAYDVRGRVPDELNEGMVRDIGHAFAEVVKPRRVVVGHDVRLSSASLSQALMEGLTAAGVEVAFIGLCGTEEVYFATAHLGLDGGIMVTASHNPVDYNGLKFVREEARPISADTGLKEIEAVLARLQQSGGGKPAARRGSQQRVDTRPAYIEHLLGYVEPSRLKPLKVVANAGNGCAALALEPLQKRLPIQMERLHWELDGSFPNGIPNPLLPENRPATVEAIRRSGADLGVAWDGDFDRCFLFDEAGTFIEGYYIVGLLASQILKRHPGGKVIHDPRLVWNTLEMVEQAGGQAVQCKSGHAFIKERMRAEDAVYGGEMSAHHYFREFSYCDSGMIPWLLICQAMSSTGQPLSRLVGDRMQRFPASGEINRRVPDPAGAIAELRRRYEKQARSVDETDGISIELDKWRFNLRMSNTEPVVRLNVESRGDQRLMQARTEELLRALAELGAVP